VSNGKTRVDAVIGLTTHALSHIYIVNNTIFFIQNLKSRRNNTINKKKCIYGHLLRTRILQYNFEAVLLCPVSPASLNGRPSSLAPF
jgi:hypothetical protein